MSAKTKRQTATTAALRQSILKVLELPPDQQEAGFDRLLPTLNIVQLELANGILFKIIWQRVAQEKAAARGLK